MKIVFLDVDGVLNSYRNVVAQGGFPFPEGSRAGNNPVHAEKNLDPLAVGMVRKLCEKAEAKIVLSSTWRKHVVFEEFGKRWDLPIIGVTPTYEDKPKSIKSWLRDNSGVTHYVIIDDDHMDDKGHQVYTDIMEGFLHKDYLQARQILGVTALV